MNFGNSFQRTSPIVLNLIIINAIVYFAQVVFGGSAEPNRVYDLFALHHYKSEFFRPYQLVTHMFMHGSFFHLLFNMLGLWMFGSIMERVWGPKRFLIFYLICGLAAALAQMGNYMYDFRMYDSVSSNPEAVAFLQEQMRNGCTVGASGAIMGILAAYGYLFPNTQLFIMPIPFPVKAKWAIIGIISIDVIAALSRSEHSVDNVAHLAHVGGALAGFLLVLYWNKTNKQTFY